MSRVIETEELIQSYYDKIKEEYPDISLKDVKKVCRAEFKMLHRVMEEGNFQEVKMQYFAKFLVTPSRIIKRLGATETAKKNGNIRKEKYEYYRSIMLNYVRKNQKIFRKYENKIKKYTGFTGEQIRAKAYLGDGHSNNS